MHPVGLYYTDISRCRKTNIKFVICPKIWAENYDQQFIKKKFVGEAKDVTQYKENVC